jgi:hypothetical protein
MKFGYFIITRRKLALACLIIFIARSTNYDFDSIQCGIERQDAKVREAIKQSS